MKLTLFVLALVLATCCAQSNNAFWGNLGDNDTYVYNFPIIRPSVFWLEFSQTVNYPPFGVINERPITSVRAFDRQTNGSGATARILAGGIGNTTVSVIFESQRGHGINFELQIHTAACN